MTGTPHRRSTWSARGRSGGPAPTRSSERTFLSGRYPHRLGHLPCPTAPDGQGPQAPASVRAGGCRRTWRQQGAAAPTRAALSGTNARSWRQLAAAARRAPAVGDACGRRAPGGGGRRHPPPVSVQPHTAGRGRGGGGRPQRLARPRPEPLQHALSRQTEDDHPHRGPAPPPHRGRCINPHRTEPCAAGVEPAPPPGRTLHRRRQPSTPTGQNPAPQAHDLNGPSPHRRRTAGTRPQPNTRPSVYTTGPAAASGRATPAVKWTKRDG